MERGMRAQEFPDDRRRRVLEVAHPGALSLQFSASPLGVGQYVPLPHPPRYNKLITLGRVGGAGIGEGNSNYAPRDPAPRGRGGEPDVQFRGGARWPWPFLINVA
jgi:hypothetical protein